MDLKYAPLRHEIKMQMPGYKVEQHNIVIDLWEGAQRVSQISSWSGQKCPGTLQNAENGGV